MKNSTKTCAFCGVVFARSPRTGVRNWEKRIVCSPECSSALRSQRAAEKTERTCIYCDRTLPVTQFRLRANGLPLSYCKECSLVKGRVRYRLNGKAKRKNARPWKPGKRERAEAKLNSAVRSKKLAKQLCEVCGSPAQAHHPDYNHPLKVRWLCTVHHGMEHWKPVTTPILEEAKLQIATAIRARGSDTPTGGRR